MGTLTLAEMRTELYYLLDSADEVMAGTGDIRANRFLNWSFYRIQLPNTFEHIERQTTQTITLVANTTSYPVTVWAIDHIRYNNTYKRLNPMSRAQLSNLTLPNGQPARFARWGHSIQLDSTPTSAEAGHTLTVYGWQEPTILSTTGAASDLNTLWDEVIVTGAAWRGWRSLGDHVRADIFREEYAALVNDARSVLAQEGHIPGWRVEVGPRMEYGR